MLHARAPERQEVAHPLQILRGEDPRNPQRVGLARRGDSFQYIKPHPVGALKEGRRVLPGHRSTRWRFVPAGACVGEGEPGPMGDLTPASPQLRQRPRQIGELTRPEEFRGRGKTDAPARVSTSYTPLVAELRELRSRRG